MKHLVDVYGDKILRPTSLIMSGVESDAYFDLAVGAGFDRLLMSYHYIQRKGKRWLRERMQKHPHVKLMIDSGAYTFHVKEEEYKQKPVSYFDDYVKKYVEWIRANKDYIFSCVEVDIANIVGFERVDYYRREFFEPLKDEGILVCYVWHEWDGKQHWEEMCKKYDYVGFSLEVNNYSEAEVMKMVNTARRYGAIVHGFALTRVELMSKIPFFSGDSTTWLVGTQYGELNWFDGRKMKRLKKDQWKTVYKQKFINLGANWDLAGQENPYELIRINLLVFKEAEKYIRKRIRGKMYWFPNGAKLVEEGGEKTLTKKLIKRVKKNNEEKETNRNTEIDEKANKTTGMEKILGTDRESNDLAEIDRPKTKYEEFLELSQPKQKAIFDLDEQISKLPPIEWFDGDCEDYLEVAKDINMETNGLSKDDVLDILYNYCVFLRDTHMLDDENDQQLIESAKFLTKKDVKDREQAIEALKQFYMQNLTGERNDFVVNEFLPSEAPPRPKEREEYLEDEEYELVDVPEEELKQYLPAPKQDGSMPEVDEIDKELKSAGIVPVRDEKGRFLKGQKKVRKSKQLWSKHFPKLACDTCYKAGECPEYKPGHVCAYEKIFKKFKTRDLQDVIDAMTSMADLNLERMQRLMLFETLDGGMPDPSLTAMIDQNMKLLMTIKQLHENRNMIVASQKRVIREDGSEETTMTITNPSGGILERLFMSSSNSEEKEERKDVTPKYDVIDAED